tara:strand:- start:1085 stop:2860 length:1776 start_codon:yes stop_codon:yes gene_type:complete
MKKIYLSAIALSVATLSFGQHAIPQRIASANTDLKYKNITQNNKAPGDTLWSDDFSNIATWSLTNTSSPTQNWIHTTDIAAIPLLAGTSDTVLFSSGANGYIYIDSDNLAGASTQNITAENVTFIDLSATSSAVLSWGQHYMSYQEIFTVGVSPDNGATWTDFIIDNGPSVSPQVREFGRKSLNISAIAGNATQVKIRFNYQGNFDWFWAIDDVLIIEAESNNLILTDPYYGTAAYPYSRIPVNQIQAIDFVGKVLNDGAINQTNTVLSVDINSGAFTAASIADTVFSGDTDSIFTVWTPPATVGVPYIATMTVTSDSIDSSPLDNTFTFPAFEVSDYIYAYDDYAAAVGQGAGGGINGTDIAFEAGNSFDIWAADNLMAIDAVVGAGTPVGSNFKGVVYERIATAPFYNKVAETKFYVTDAASIGNVTQLLFSAPIPLAVGETYFVGISVISEFYYGTSGNSPGPGGTASTTSSISYGTMDAPVTGKNFYTTNTPMVRMNFDPTLPVGLVEVNNEVKFNVFPNPSNGVFNINLSSNDVKNVNLTVKNVVGQTVLTETISGNTNHKISLTDHSKGIYFLTVGNETVKLIVE